MAAVGFRRCSGRTAGGFGEEGKAGPRRKTDEKVRRRSDGFGFGIISGFHDL